jgi:putative Ca2+/H+ antiporter (TMEM165/GDT1 family)
MDWAIAATVFPIIALGELPDKTMFASLVLSTKASPRAVWLGAAAAFAVHVVIAVTVGVALFRVLPTRVLDSVVALMFIAGAVLAFREGVHDRRSTDDQPPPVMPHGRAVTTAFVAVFIFEWGDLTQILTANLAAHYHSALSVGVGALAALWSVAAVAVVSGQGLLKVLNLATIRFVTAAILFALGVYAAVTAVR